MRDAIYRAMNVVRVYTKLPTQKDADFDRPYTIHRGGTLLDVAEMIHKDFAAQAPERPRLGEPRARRHARQRGLRVARQGRDRTAHLSDDPECRSWVTTIVEQRAKSPRTLDQVADLLEFQGANAFRVRAYRNGARAIRNLSQSVARLVEEDPQQLTEIEGVGEAWPRSA